MRLRDLCRSAVVGYLLGTIPAADIAAKLAGGPDLRDVGSGNPGATNAAAVLGSSFGAGVLLVDIAKGSVAARGGQRIGGAVAGSALAQVGACSAVIGHCYPVWTGFRGGKGVATGVGQVLATFPAFFPADLAIALATVTSSRWKRKAFAATNSANVAWVVLSLVWNRKQMANLWGPDPTPALPIGACVSSLVMYRRFVQANNRS